MQTETQGFLSVRPLVLGKDRMIEPQAQKPRRSQRRTSKAIFFEPVEDVVEECLRAPQMDQAA